MALPLSWIAYGVALLLFAGIHGSYLIAASTGQVPWCVPYWDSCTFISTTGREPPAKLWFKFATISASIGAMLFWWCAASWRRQLGQTGYRKSLRMLPWTGIVGSLFLIQYTVALGEVGDIYGQLRRNGVVMCFGLTFISHLWLAQLVLEWGRRIGDQQLVRWSRALIGFCFVILCTGIVSVILQAVMDDYEAIEEAFEWWLALFLCCQFAVMGRIWHRQGGYLEVRLPDRNA